MSTMSHRRPAIMQCECAPRSGPGCHDPSCTSRASAYLCRGGAHPWRCPGPSPVARRRRRGPRRCPTRLVSGSGWLRFAVGSASGLRRSGSAAGSGAAAGAFLAPGRRAPAAIPRPLTSGSGLAAGRGRSRRCRRLRCPPRRWSGSTLGGWTTVGSPSFGAALAGAFLAPGRLAPPAMPRPLTSGSAAAGCLGSALGGGPASAPAAPRPVACGLSSAGSAGRLLRRRAAWRRRPCPGR